ncbi:MAG: cytochrome c biogenesis protein CcsA [Pseudomonadota bacterium]
MALIIAASVPSIVCYLASAGLLLRRFFKHSAESTKVPISLLVAALVCHLMTILLTIKGLEEQKLSLAFVLLVVAWLIAFSMLVANRYIKNLVFLPIVSISAALFTCLHLLIPTTTDLSAQMSGGMIVHISISMLAFGFLGIAMLYALQLGYINYQLKHKRRSLLSDDLPPLMSVEHILYQLMTIGTLILALALASGFAFMPSMFADGYAHKTVLSTLALGVFVSSLIFHKLKGMKTRSAIWLNGIGITLLSLSYFGSRIVQEVILGM